MSDIFPYKQFLRNAHNLITAVIVENDNIVKLRTVKQKLVFLQSRADKSLLAVKI